MAQKGSLNKGRFLDDALCQHGIRYLLEAGDICAGYVIAFAVVFLRRVVDVFKDIRHDRVEAVIGVVKGPRITGRILLHFQRGGSNTTSISGLARREVDLGFLEYVDGLRGCLLYTSDAADE